MTNVIDFRKRASENDINDIIVEAQQRRIQKAVSDFIKAFAEQGVWISYINHILFTELLKGALKFGIEEMDGGDVALTTRTAVDILTEPDEPDGGYNERRKLIAKLVKLTGVPGSDPPVFPGAPSQEGA